jgi:alanyl-tRNA synthetase
MMTSRVIREKFFEFFRSKGHIIVPSAPIVVKDDPTLMFTNAGMNQFKDYFLGNKKSPNPRVANTQKCLRVSGKHNDLEEVGVDTYHHTMFEMLGNWSFGDYFKKEAIAWSWELLTGIYKIPADRLYVTVFGGDEKEKLPKDDESINEWKKWIPEDRILLFGKKDNFWEMGETGPCGPCTEIHVDCRNELDRKKNGKELVNNDHPQVIEIWNDVFIHFNRLKDGSLEELPARHVDTGMGLERLVRVLQNKNSNYDTDIFTDLIAEIEKITKKKYKANDSKEAISFRVIADHVRGIAFTIADGQLPSNTGAGYVIRRILRRAVRYYYSYLDYKQPLLHQLISLLSAQFKNVFPELEKQKEFVSKVIKEEEHNFLKTLEAGLQRLDQIISSAKTAKTKIIVGDIAFELYDTFGFPLDLTKLIAAEKKLSVDEAGFEAAMLKQKNRSRAASTLDTEDWIVLDDFALNSFVGYDSLEIKTKVVKYRRIKTKGREAFQIVLEATPFYAESGGQVGDTGWLQFGPETVEVTDTKKENDLSIHFTDKLPAALDGSVIAKVNFIRRSEICVHHSATHLMHAALRSVLGKHVTQKGSLVNDVHLRFDFSHFAKMTDEEISKVEALVNEKIRENIPVIIKEMPKNEALALGALALFGEKYGDMVRVVIINPSYSIELCGGTHVGSTGELGFFAITHETAVAAGVRRIEAVSGKMAEKFINDQIAKLRGIREILKNPNELKAVEAIKQENEELKKKLEKIESRNLSELKNTLVKKAENINGFSFIGEIVDVSNPEALKKICFDLKSEIRNYAVVLAANIDRKAHVAILLDEKLAAEKNLDASRIIKEHIASIIKGGGGGQKTLATAGGEDASNLPKVIEKVRSLL